MLPNDLRVLRNCHICSEETYPVAWLFKYDSYAMQWCGSGASGPVVNRPHESGSPLLIMSQRNFWSSIIYKIRMILWFLGYPVPYLLDNIFCSVAINIQVWSGSDLIRTGNWLSRIGIRNSGLRTRGWGYERNIYGSTQHCCSIAI